MEWTSVIKNVETISPLHPHDPVMKYVTLDDIQTYHYYKEMTLNYLNILIQYALKNGDTLYPNELYLKLQSAMEVFILGDARTHFNTEVDSNIGIVIANIDVVGIPEVKIRKKLETLFKERYGNIRISDYNKSHTLRSLLAGLEKTESVIKIPATPQNSLYFRELVVDIMKKFSSNEEIIPLLQQLNVDTSHLSLDDISSFNATIREIVTANEVLHLSINQWKDRLHEWYDIYDIVSDSHGHYILYKLKKEQPTLVTLY